MSKSLQEEINEIKAEEDDVKHLLWIMQLEIIRLNKIIKLLADKLASK